MPTSPSTKPLIAVTMGDPGGVGPEVIAKTLLNRYRIPSIGGAAYLDALILLIGTGVVFEFLEEELGLKLPLNPIPALHRDFLRDDSVNFLDVTEEAARLLGNIGRTVIAGPERPKQSVSGLFEIGRVSRINAAMALASLKTGAYQGAAGLIDALVTAPVNKEAMRLLEPKFAGHTEYLARVARTKEFAMMFLSESGMPLTPPLSPEGRGRSGVLRVTLVTIHVPLKKVSRLVTEEAVLEKIRLTDDFLKEKLRIQKPRIGVAALNPHGSETGEEEKKVIEPAIERARREKRHVLGPFAGDCIFHDAYQGKYDAVIAMYHDQALAPFKLAAFETGVNLTLGLPYVRTSPDHGTAFEIAYQGKANPLSMESALQTAIKLGSVDI